MYRFSREKFINFVSSKVEFILIQISLIISKFDHLEFIRILEMKQSVILKCPSEQGSERILFLIQRIQERDIASLSARLHV